MPTTSFADAPEHGAAGSDDPSAEARDLAACRALLANGSRTFLAASYLLPRAVREPACALYAFCRVADDAIDAAPPGSVDAALAGLRRRLDGVYAASAGGDDVVDRAFAAVVRRHAIPRALPEALIEGFAWDAAGRRTPSALARACDLGVAMQLSNIARDVGEDARAGRLYLPLSWLREAGVDGPSWLARPRYDERVASVVARLLAHADALYARAGAGIAELPASCRVGINAARFLYAEIGHEVARRGCNSVDTRAVVSPRRKAALLARAALCLRPRRIAVAPLPATRHLVEAAAAAVASPRHAAAEQRGRVVWLIELFERLERRDQLHHAGGWR